MVDRTDQQTCLERIELKCQHIEDERVLLSNDILSAWAIFTAIPAGDIKNCINYIIEGLADCLSALVWYLDKDNSYDPKWLIPYYLENHTVGGISEYELTAEKIIGAWLTTTLDNQQWTIGLIDYMRKEIWDKPFDFPLIAGQIGPG